MVDVDTMGDGQGTGGRAVETPVVYFLQFLSLQASLLRRGGRETTGVMWLWSERRMPALHAYTNLNHLRPLPPSPPFAASAEGAGLGLFSYDGLKDVKKRAKPVMVNPVGMCLWSRALDFRWFLRA